MSRRKSEKAKHPQPPDVRASRMQLILSSLLLGGWLLFLGVMAATA